MKRAKYRASGSCLAASHRVDGSEDRQCQAELAILGQRVGIDYARATFVLASSFLKTADLTRSGVDAGRPALKACLEYLREGDTLLVTKLDRLARSTPDLYRIVSELTARGVAFKVLDDPSIDTSSRTGKLIMGILALIAEFENDIRRERQQDGINKAKARGLSILFIASASVA